MHSRILTLYMTIVGKFFMLDMAYNKDLVMGAFPEGSKGETLER